MNHNGDAPPEEQEETMDRVPPRPASIPKEIYEFMLRVEGRTLEVFAHVGKISRELASIASDIREVKADVAELKNRVSDARGRLESIPEIVDDVIEKRDLEDLRDKETKRKKFREWLAQKAVGRVIDIGITFLLTACGAAAIHYLVSR